MDLKTLAQTLSNLERRVKSSIPSVTEKVGQHSLLFFKRNFDNGGYTPDKTFVPWAKRKYALNKPLVRSGELRDSFSLQRNGSTVTVVNDAPYAAYVNDGTNDTPARPIVYDSKELEAEVKTLLEDEIKKLFRF